MSRPWSRIGVRSAAVALLLTGVVGGYYLGEEQDVQQQGINDQRVAQVEAAEQALIKERHAAHTVANAQKRLAEREAARKAEEAAKAATERTRKAEEAASRKKREAAAAANDANAPAKPYTGPIPESCNQYSGNRQIGCAMLLQSGFGLDQMPCLDKLWTKESGWNHKAQNRSSGAYGIPQALPGNKMASAGADWQNSPATQIKWGLGYIKGRYGTPCSAWQTLQTKGYY
ncbi:lytic transglycosylase domain-containing protein [Polymorphospora rubra]|uniref:aggregation-promoting factor C-terminal-like domain-containing protein n=1 Tax=Polymorphospora rubra TaxID=338584 RepID=UPI0033E701D9